MVEVADTVIAQSHVMRDDIEHQFGERVARKTVVLPNPVDADRLVRLSTETGSVPTKVGNPQLVSAGRLTYQKGFDRLVTAFAADPGAPPRRPALDPRRRRGAGIAHRPGRRAGRGRRGRPARPGARTGGPLPGRRPLRLLVAVRGLPQLGGRGAGRGHPRGGARAGRRRARSS